MTDPLSLTADQILALPERQPQKLFTLDETKDKAIYRKLALRWHPDQPGGNKHVFAHLSVMYARAARSLSPVTTEVTIAGRSGKSILFRCRKQHVTELGEMLIGENNVAFCLKPEFEDLFHKAAGFLSGFRYGGPAMQKEMARFLPEVAATLDGKERLALIVRRPPGMVLLADLVEHMGGAVDPRHAGWIGSGLHNIGCYLEWAGLTHNGIGPYSVWVDPAGHGTALLGGWFYAMEQGKRLLALSDDAMEVAPRSVLADKKATKEIDAEMIRSTLKRITAGQDIPPAMDRWFKLAGTGNAIEDYAAWTAMLRTAFGPPKFIELDVSPNAIY